MNGLTLEGAVVTFIAGEIVIDLPEGAESLIKGNHFHMPTADAPRLKVNIGGKPAITFDPALHWGLTGTTS